MKTAPTLRRELKRLRGMRARRGLTPEQRNALLQAITTLDWVLRPTPSPNWLRPSLRIDGVDCRKGTP